MFRPNAEKKGPEKTPYFDILIQIVVEVSPGKTRKQRNSATLIETIEKQTKLIRTLVFSLQQSFSPKKVIEQNLLLVIKVANVIH